MKQETLEFIKEAKARGSVLGLSNMRHLMEQLGNVQERLPIIHIAGTNGKGSVGAYLSAIFRAAGLSVGRYTSPAVFDPLEVFTLNDVRMKEEEYERLAEKIRQTCLAACFSPEELPTLFELETALAFLWFDEQKPDLILMECGMGGSGDATNVFAKPLASVITSISLDHTAILGDSLEKIAAVKAGIIKEGCPVFSAPQEKEVETLLSRRAGAAHADICFVDKDRIRIQSEQTDRLLFTYQRKNLQLGLETKLTGHYQTINASLAVETAFAILPGFSVAEEEIPALVSEGIHQAYWPGRFETICEDPRVILDGAHNPGAAEELKKTIEACFGRDAGLVFILGVLGDKDHRQMLEILLPFARAVITLTPDNSRALSGERLAGEAEELLTELYRTKMPGKPLPPVRCAKSAQEALRTACSLARKEGLPVLACGSLSYLGDLKEKVGLQFEESVL